MIRSTRPARRRHTWALALGLLAGLLPIAATAQAPYPNKPVKLVVPYPPGAAVDLVGRTLAGALQSRWGQTVVVENRDGGGSQIGTAHVAKSVPDGYTLLINVVDAFTLMPLVRSSMPYEVPKDFSFIARVAEVPYAVHINHERPLRTLQEFLAHAKAHPDGVRYGSAGPGSLPHVAMEMLASQAGVKMLHVPYRGMAAVTNDLVAGHIDAAVVSPATMAPHVTSGKVRTLAVMAPRRAAQWPQTPSTAESGSAGVEAELAFALAGPAGIDPAIVARLARDVDAILKDPAVVRTLADRGFSVAFLDPVALASHIRQETRKWAAVVEKNRITAE